MKGQRRWALRPTLVPLDGRCLLSTGLTPAQVTQAYGLDAITFSAGGQTIKGDGSGETIAIVDAFHDPFLASDLATFDQTYGLNDPGLTQINLAGGRTNDGWAQEESLDVEWAHAIAPGARIIVVEAKSDSFKDLLAAVDTARVQPGVVAVSMSWGGPETSKEKASDVHFTTPAGHTGITFIAASGDEGAVGGAESPASSARVLAVGGTSLLVSDSGSYLGESAWIGSSGGFSRYIAEPAYQRGVQGTGRRSTPDVAFVADPVTGVSVYATAPSTGQPGWYTIGGTSVGTPGWAGIIAIADQGRAAAGISSLDGATQTLPTLYALPASDFHQVGSLTTTGLGSPNGAGLVDGLASSVTTVSAPAISARVRVRHASVVRKAAVAAPSSSLHVHPHLIDAALHALAAKAVHRG